MEGGASAAAGVRHETSARSARRYDILMLPRTALYDAEMN
jgi:hypothetical protein